MTKIIILAFILASFNGFAGSVITVGADNDNACDFHNIQDAIDNGNNDTIRIASNKNYFESLEMLNSNDSLIGGYANCQMASQNFTDLSQAIITGNGSDPVIYVNAVLNSSYSVSIKSLIIANGSTGIALRSQNNALLSVIIDGVRSFNNNLRGFDILSINGGQADVVMNDVTVDYNDDGGINCQGNDTELKIAGNSKVSNNQATKGAGFSIINGCDVTVYSPTQIVDNSATGSGGGFEVSNATLSVFGSSGGCENGICFGTDDEPVMIQNNVADSDNNGFGDGGGVYVNNTQANATLINAVVADNKANNGGGLYAQAGSDLLLLGYESPGQPCWKTGSCSILTGNKAKTGGGFGVSSEASVVVYAAHVHGNRADNAVVGAIYGDGEAEIINDMIYDNGSTSDNTYADEALFKLLGNDIETPVLKLSQVSVADNHVNGVVLENKKGSLSLNSSIVFDQQDIYLESGDQSTAQFECVIVHESGSFSAGGTVTVVDREIQPVFVNPGGANYHLRVDSPAIDFCYEIEGNDGSDLDYDERGIDNPDVDNLHGIYDIGADEFHISNDIIFKNGFEQD